MIQAVPYVGDPATLPLINLRAVAQIRTRNGFDQSSLEELAATIREHGIIEPLIVRPDHGNPDGGHIVIAGERRLLAASMAGLSEVPVLIRDVDAATAQALQAIENLQREDLALADVVDGVAAMAKQPGKSVRDIAKSLGKSVPWVSKHLSLSRVPKDVRTVMDEGLTKDAELIGTLAQIRKLPDGKGLDKFAQLVDGLAAGTTTRATARAALEKLKAKDEPKAPNGEDEEESEAGDSVPVSARFAMTNQIAQELLHALKFTKEHDSPRGSIDAARNALQEFMTAQGWPTGKA